MTSDRDVGEELLKQAAAPPAGTPGGPKETVEKTIRRERRRVGIWAGATILLWLLTAAWCIANIWFYLVFFHPRLAHLLTETAVNREASSHWMRVLADYLFYANVVWPVLLTVAAIVTVLFILRSRRATLRQIQASLAEISAQIRVLSREG